MIKNGKIIKNTGIQTNVDDQERNQKQTRQRHHYFSTYSGSEELRPFHKLSGGVEKFPAKVSPDN
jgi:hypothetical protein